MTDEQKQLIWAVAALIGGVALLFKAWAHWDEWQKLRGGVRGLGRLGSPADGTIIKKVTKYRVRNIKDRVALIAALAKRDYLKPKTRERALAVLTEKVGSGKDRNWKVPPKDWKAEIKALFDATTDPRSPDAQRYTNDPVGVDLYTAPEKSRILAGGDCDDQVSDLAARLMSVGYQPELVTIATPQSPNGDFSHILLRVGSPQQGSDGGSLGGDREWVYLDPTMAKEKGFGWEPPGLSTALRYGQPYGIVAKAKVFRF